MQYGIIKASPKIFYMDKKKVEKNLTFPHQLGLPGGPSLKDEDIEVVLCELESDSKNLSLIRDLKKEGKIVLGIGLLPFIAMGEDVIRDSLERAMQLQQSTDGCLLLNKEAILTQKSLSFDEVENFVNTIVFNIEEGLQDILLPGYINNIESQTLRDVLKDCGTFWIARGKGNGQGRINKALSEAVDHLATQGFDVQSAHKLIVKVIVSEHTELQLKEINDIEKFISSLSHNIDVIFGVSNSESEEKILEIVMLATGMDIVM